MGPSRGQVSLGYTDYKTQGLFIPKAPSTVLKLGGYTLLLLLDRQLTLRNRWVLPQAQTKAQ